MSSLPASPTLDEYQQRALQTRKRRAPAAKAARKLLAVQIERSKQMGLAARQAQAATVATVEVVSHE